MCVHGGTLEEINLGKIFHDGIGNFFRSVLPGIESDRMNRMDRPTVLVSVSVSLDF